jgi:hypothetical protein
MRLKRYLKEEFIGMYKYGGLATEVYENPNPNEIRFMPTIYNEPKHPELMDCSIRFLALGSKQKLFIWASDGGVHYHVLEWLQLKKKIPTDVYGREPADIVSGYASPQGNKMKFERGYGLGTRGYDISKGIWDWLDKYFVNMPQLMNYIEKDGRK